MTGSRHLWLDPIFGASGDMLLGALVGIGAPIEAIEADLDALGVEGWSLEVGPTDRAGISATRVEVIAEDTTDHRAWSTIDRLLAGAALPPTVADGARATFRLLGQTEAAIHSIAIDEVHFHEVGAVDAIVDIVGTWSALDRLALDSVAAGPVGLGRGTVGAAHGRLPIPAPATLAILGDLPVTSVDSATETVTPTGAALLRSIVDRWGPLPTGTLRTSARGAGGRNPDSHPNVLTAMVIETAEGPAGVPSSEAVVVATNLDDASPEVLGHTIERLLAAGADDAWVVPITMKKSRPGHELRVLCRPDLTTAVQEIVFAETGTLGLRTSPVTKHAVERRIETVTVRGAEVGIKVGRGGAKPEHDDLVALSRACGVPIRALAFEALRVWSDRQR